MEFSIPTFSGLVLLLSLLVFPSCIIALLRLSFGLPIIRFPAISMFSLLHLLQSFSPHGLTISVSIILFSHLYVCHTCSCSYFFIPDFLNPLFPSQHLISVLSNKFCSAFLSAQVSPPYILTYSSICSHGRHHSRCCLS